VTEQLDPEDAKLVGLARSARARNSAAQAAAVRDETGRTYVATTVELPALRLSALQAVIAAAASSGAQALESAVVVGEAAGEEPGLAALRALAPHAALLALSDEQARSVSW
jgi:hypothetical protein